MLGLAPTDWEAAVLSLKVAVVAVAFALPFGIAAAYALAFLRFRGRLALELAVNLPLTLPPVVIGYLLLMLLGRNGPLGHLLEVIGVRIVFTWKAAVIASAVVGFPLLVRSIRTAMESVDPRLIQASRTLGARWHDTLMTVIIPLSLRGILAGSSLMFARSLGEFGATIIVAGNIPGVTQTIPLAIYEYSCSPSSERLALALCAMAIIISIAALLLHEAAVGKMTGRR